MTLDLKQLRSHRWLFLAGLGVLLVLPACSERPPVAMALSGDGSSQAREVGIPQSLPVEAASSIHARLAAGSGPVLDSLTPAERDELKRLYEDSGDAPLWADWMGRPDSNASHALALLRGAAGDALDPADYATARLEALEAVLAGAPAPAFEDVASFDLELSAGLLRYLHHLHRGRVDPRTLGHRLVVPPDRLDVVTGLRAALEGGRIPELATELAPPLPQYGALRAALVRYRSLAADGDFEPLPPLEKSIRPGEPYAGLGAIHRRLVAFGDLSADIPAPAEETQPDPAPHPVTPDGLGHAVYDDRLAEGVKRFQVRHGIDADGVIGKATHAALDVPLAWRVRQIELALERQRWMPDVGHERFIMLNIPMFRVFAWDSSSSGGPSVSMRAIVGRARNTATPVMNKTMHAVIFRPYWNIPTSILRNEILPAFERDATFLQREEMEIVGGNGDGALPVAVTEENIALLRQGALRLRQRPGPENALGLVKFIFPNEENVYLHDTPGKRLFSRSRRDFSHGCVRIENPAALAEWVLSDEPEWTRERILAAMADTGNVSKVVSLKRPIPVILFYTTAVVMPEDGTIHFAEDIYGHDAALDRSLTRRPGS